MPGKVRGPGGGGKDAVSCSTTFFNKQWDPDYSNLKMPTFPGPMLF
jgi:hypothetical protein